ncbi:MAG: Uma2 family endonuclease [Caldilineaceae bacterium]|nr:Uma2 family endonuclease [Caldilineaceae bacterium]
MAITKPWTAPVEPLTAEPVSPVDLSKPIPSWNTPEYPAEWPRSDDMSVTPRHVVILRYLYGALTALLGRPRRPFAVNQEIGLHFVDADGQTQRCDPDLIVMPFPNTGEGSLRRQDMPCPPDCVIEVASPSTADKDLGRKKAWYAGMGIREYWILDPVDSDDPSRFENGLLPDGPMMGWRLERGRYEPLATSRDAAARTWSAYSPVLDCDIFLSQELHRDETDGGYRMLDPETGEPLPSESEKNELLAKQDELLAEQDELLAEKDELLAKQIDQLDDRNAQLAAKERALKEAVTTMAQLRYGDPTADQLRLMMQRTSTPMPNIDVVQEWIAKPSSEEFLDLARQHFGLAERS